jgi:hypothetical protein
MVPRMNLILGHNQFIGINHTSEDRSREREKKFSKIENIYNVVEMASEIGFKGMIVETHPRMIDFFNYYKENQTFDMDFYLQVPYVVGYVKKMNEKGIFGLMSELMGQTGLIGAGGMALRGASSFLKRDYLSMAMSVLKLEISPFTEVNIKALLLHNVFTDLLLFLEISDAFSTYENYVKDDLGLNSGFNTLNFTSFSNRIQEWDIKPEFIMTPVNPKGFDMNPSKDIVEKSIGNYDGKIIAMNILGGGAFSLEDSKSYLNSFQNIKHCVIGASSKEHLKGLIETFNE